MTRAADRQPAESVGHLTHVPVLDGVRAASILLVIAAHVLPLGPKFLRLNETAGPMGMSLFFCLSGFLIVSMLSRNAHVPTFLVRRTLRIIPAVVLYLFVLWLFLRIPGEMILSNLLFVNNYWPVGLSNDVAPTSHLWSLSVEMQFYAAMALAVLALGRRGVWLVPPAMLVITAIRISYGPAGYIDIATHLRSDEILVGGTLALAAMHRGHTIRRALARPRVAWGALFAATALWLVACHPDSGPVNYARPYFAATMVGIVMHARFGVITDILESRLAAYIARISYALYIWHMLAVFGWMNQGGDWERYLLKRPFSFAFMWAAAHVSTFWWEARWQALAKRLTTRAARA